jgi:hypothetical protein
MLVLSKEWSFYVCLLAILSTNGLAWGQVGNRFKEEPVKPFLQPYSPSNNEEPVKPFLKPYSPANKNGGETPKKVMLTPTKKSPKSALGKEPKSKIKLASPEIGATGSSPDFERYKSSSAGSKSFLDGYLLRSLHEKKIEGKKDATDEDLLKKKKDSFIK